jgi:predicted  nucleic acid-binding Zn-ribbon protein
LYFSAWIDRFNVVSNRLNMYRRFYLLQRKEISELENEISKLKETIRNQRKMIRETEDYLFSRIFSGRQFSDRELRNLNAL